MALGMTLPHPVIRTHGVTATKNPAERSRSCSRTRSGKPCIFPFKYLGVEHNSCQGHGWCVIEVDSGRNLQRWSRCDDSCYSREENETPTRGFNSLSAGK